MTNPFDLDELLDNMAADIRAHCERRALSEPLMIGIKRGGAWIAERLHHQLGYKDPLGKLNIAFYRDDFSTIGVHPTVSPSELPLNVDGRHIVLVDDVLYTGRTIRAAMNEIFDYGRPRTITLAVLIDRNDRELPVQADIIAKTIRLEGKEYVKLSGPKPLILEIKLKG